MSVLLLTTVVLILCSCVVGSPNCTVLFVVNPDASACNNMSLLPTEEVSYNYTGVNLACAMETILTSTQQSKHFTVCIMLLPGTHTLLYSNKTITHDIVIEGAGFETTNIICPKDPLFNELLYEDFPIRFGSQAKVSISAVTFSKCKRPLLFYDSHSVNLNDVLFMFFTQSAIEIYNTPYVTVNNCTFLNNTSSGKGQIRNSGNSGALSIGFNETFEAEIIPEILVQDSHFTNNTAYVAGSCAETGSVLFSKIYTQRGGAVAGYFATPHLKSVVTIRGTTFQNNIAQDSGGAVYINLSGADGAQTNITYKKNRFINNKAIDGGGIETTFDTSESVKRPSLLLIQDCYFEGNIGSFGGAIKPVQISSQGNLNWVIVENCTFIQNYSPVGSAIHFQSLFLKYGASADTQRIRVENCTFMDNFSQQSVVFITHNNVNFTGSNVFIGNIGSAVRVEESLLSVNGELLFLNNSNHHEGPSGTLYIYLFSQILLNPGANISFINNTGRNGAAIVVRSPRISNEFARTLYNPQCFLQFAVQKLAPILWSNYEVTLTFSGNRALLAPVLFITSLVPCSWFNNSDEFFETNIKDTWSFMTIHTNYILSGDGTTVSDIPERYIQTEMQDLCISNFHPGTQCTDEEENYNVTKVCAYPGQYVNLSVTALDQFGRPTSGFLHIGTSKNSPAELGFSPSIAQTSAINSDIIFQYNSSNLSGKTHITMEASFSATRVSSDFILEHLGCPPGFYFDEVENCVCEVLPEVLTCDSRNEAVLLANGLWGAPPFWSRKLVTYTCPAGYCNCTGLPGENSTEGCALIFSDPESLCDESRTGVLCGKCKQSLGVGMLTTRCREFNAKFPMYYWLIPLLVIFIVVSLVVIVKAAFSIPPLMLSFLFYIQVAPTMINTIDGPFSLRSEAMSCISSTLALYVPYDFSLQKELSAVESFGLRFISPILSLVLLPVILRIKYKSKQWRGVWTLVLLMYPMAVHTSSSILFCPSLTRSSNGTTETITVWFYDGTIDCFQNSHIVLTILATACLILALVLMPIMAIMVYQKELSQKFSFLDHRCLEKVSLALTGPYKDIYRWWTPYELTRRFTLVVAAVFSPGNLKLPLSLTAVILTVQWYTQPYKDWKANVAELFSLCVLVVILCFGSATDFKLVAAGSPKFTLWPLFYLPLLVGAVCFVALFGFGLRKGYKSTVREIKTFYRKWKEHSRKNIDIASYSRRHSTFGSWSYKRDINTQVVSLDNSDNISVATSL